MANVSVEIMGQNLVLSSDADAEWVKQLAQRVNDTSKVIRAKTRSVNAVDLAILTALHFAEDLERMRTTLEPLRAARDELEQLRKEHRELLEQIGALSRRLSQSFQERK